MKERSPVMIIVFGILTCGIYTLYWFVTVTNEIEANLKQRDGSCSSGGMAFLFTILTCGIYMFYWYYKQGSRIAQLQRENNVPPVENSVLYLILTIFGLGVIADVLMQSELNKVAAAARG